MGDGDSIALGPGSANSWRGVWVGAVAAAMLTILLLAPAPASAEVVADASCGPVIGSNLTGPRRFAQTFTVQQTGRMVAARFPAGDGLFPTCEPKAQLREATSIMELWCPTKAH